jgi:hypothetical protein
VPAQATCLGSTEGDSHNLGHWLHRIRSRAKGQPLALRYFGGVLGEP